MKIKKFIQIDKGSREYIIKKDALKFANSRAKKYNYKPIINKSLIGGKWLVYY